MAGAYPTLPPTLYHFDEVVHAQSLLGAQEARMSVAPVAATGTSTCEEFDAERRNLCLSLGGSNFTCATYLPCQMGTLH
jgi:hypothetical protein